MTKPNGNVERIFELTLEGRVWPCCYYATDAEYPELEGMDISDPVLDKPSVIDKLKKAAATYEGGNVGSFK